MCGEMIYDLTFRGSKVIFQIVEVKVEYFGLQRSITTKNLHTVHENKSI